MLLNTRSKAVNRLAEQPAARKRISKTDAVRLALEKEIGRLDAVVPLRELIRPLQGLRHGPHGDGVGLR